MKEKDSNIPIIKLKQHILSLNYMYSCILKIAFVSESFDFLQNQENKSAISEMVCREKYFSEANIDFIEKGIYIFSDNIYASLYIIGKDTYSL